MFRFFFKIKTPNLKDVKMFWDFDKKKILELELSKSFYVFVIRFYDKILYMNIFFHFKKTELCFFDLEIYLSCYKNQQQR